MIRKNYRQIKEKLKYWVFNKKKSDNFLADFKSNSTVRDVKKLGEMMISVSLQDFSHPFFARNYPHTDIKVLKQIFIDKEYKPVVDYFIDNSGIPGELKIIDAGANVGYFSLYIKNFIPKAHIACVEPDENNMNVLVQNLKNFIDTGEVSIYRNGLGPVSDKFLKIDNNFRGGKDWSLTVSESVSPTELKSITVQRIIENNNWDHVDVLKIDIEGGERFLFAKEADVSYLNIVKVISLEIHDEFDVRNSIYEVLIKKDFIILNFGETTLAINKKYL